MPDQIIRFTEKACEWWNFPIPERESSELLLPSLFGVKYGAPVLQEPLLSASQALDIVKNALYPSLEKQDYPYSKEIMDNYKTLLGYEIPSYYYTDGYTTLTYSKQSEQYFREGSNQIEIYHYIRVGTPGDYWGTDIRVYDPTGMIAS
jgi:hypothetical protein